MGTRGAVGVINNGKYFVTYNHWDSYPDSLGQEIVDFCQRLSEQNIEQLKEKISKVQLVNEDCPPSKKTIERYVSNRFYSKSVSSGKKTEWYCLLRDLQGVEMLRAILNGTCSHMIDSLDSLRDSLFCEYAYIVNLDNNSLEFYEGSNKSPDTNSPLPLPQVEDRGYYPVRFNGRYPLDNISDNWIKELYPDEG